MSQRSTVKVGTRDSKLARLQTDSIVARLQESCPQIVFEIVHITTLGDKVRNKPLFEMGGRGVFVKELEEALLADEVDLVVHSLKDLPTDMPKHLALAAVLDRSDPRDVLLSKDNLNFETLAPGARVASSSRRRTAQLKALRNDLSFVDIRGNIDTRVSKLDQGQCDAIVLAAAGLLRIGLDNRIAEYFDINISTPAVGQGVLAIECRADDQFICQLTSKINDDKVRAQITAERAFLDRLGGGCSIPIGAIAQVIDSDTLSILGCVAALDGSRVIRTTVTSSLDKAEQLGAQLAEKMFAMGAEEILGDLIKSSPSVVSPP